MSEDRYRKLFGEVALELGFVTPSQLYDALTVQLKRKTEGAQDKLLGQVLLEMGHLDPDQIQRIIDELYPVMDSGSLGSDHSAERDDDDERTGGERTVSA